MYTFSSFKNKTVFLNNNEIWTIYDLIFSKIELKVVWFVIKKNLINYSYFYFKDIESIDLNKVIIKNELSNINSDNYEIIWKSVYDLLENKIWFVDDIDFNSLTWKLLAFSLDINRNYYFINRFSSNLRQKNYIKINSKNIISLEKDRIIIKTNNSIKESKKILENINKFFINVWVAIKWINNN